MAKRRKKVKPKICPHCGQKYYALFSHLDACTGSRDIVQGFKDKIIRAAEQKSPYSYMPEKRRKRKKK